MRKLAEQVLGHSALVVISIFTQAGQGSDVDFTLVVKGPESNGIRCRCHRFQVVQFAKMAVDQKVSTGVLLLQESGRFSITQGGDSDVFHRPTRLVVQVADKVPHLLTLGQVFVPVDDFKTCPELAPLVDVAVESADGKYWEPDGSSWIRPRW